MPSHTNRETYSATDIERYHNGNMPAAERHALEKAALEDPFLSDAIDGYEHTKTGAADVEFLKQQLQNRNGKIVPISRKRIPVFIRVAAMAVLLAGFGWLTYTLSFSTKSNLAFQTKTTPQYKEAPVLQPQAADSTGNKAAASAEANDTAAVREVEITNKDAVQNRTAPPDAGVAAEETTFSKPHAADAPLTNSESSIAAKQLPKTVLKARVVDVHNNAVPYATVTNKQNKAIATTDTAGNFSVATPDSNLTVAVNSAGFQSRQTMLSQTDTGMKIVLQPAPAALDEVAVNGYGKKRSSHKDIQLQNVEPVGGRNLFDMYVDQNLKVPEEVNTLSGKKEIVLSFNLDKDGNAVNIKVEKPLCAACDSVIVRLIRNSGKWKKTGKQSKAKASIRF